MRQGKSRRTSTVSGREKRRKVKDTETCEGGGRVVRLRSLPSHTTPSSQCPFRARFYRSVWVREEKEGGRKEREGGWGEGPLLRRDNESLIV